MTVVEAPARMFGVVVVATGAGPLDGCAAGTVCGVGARVMRPIREAHSDEGSTRLRSTGLGGLTSIAGNGSAETVCCALAAEMLKETIGTRKLEASRQMRRRVAAVMMEDMVQPRYDVSGTSQRTKSHRCAFQHPYEANVCTPRPTSSRVTTADGRSPGSRVVTLRRLPRTEIPSGIGRKIRRLQLRGQPRHWGSFPAPHSLLIPKRGEP